MPTPFPGPSVAYPPYRSRSVQALVELHEQFLRSFLDTWTEARGSGLVLPESEDPDYASLEALLDHVISASAGYLAWLDRSLGLGLPPRPAPSGESGPDRIETILEAWRGALAGLEEEGLYRPGYPTNRGVETGVEGMLQHAVMHPIRHEYQLRRLLRARA